MSAEPAFARAALAQAEALDAVLDGWRPAPATASLTDRILATAPTPRVRRFAWLSPAALAAGLAAACAAGVIVGVEISAQITTSATTSATTAPPAATEQVAATNSMSLEPSLDLEGAS